MSNHSFYTQGHKEGGDQEESREYESDDKEGDTGKDRISICIDCLTIHSYNTQGHNDGSGVEEGEDGGEVTDYDQSLELIRPSTPPLGTKRDPPANWSPGK